MAQLAIAGHKTRGKEVIEILEMLGGINIYKYSGENEEICFAIGGATKVIYYDWINDWLNNCYGDEDGLVFTLEEFLEKYPYKVGDKVNYVKYKDECPNVYTIQKIWWNGVTIEYLLDSSGFSVLTKDLQPYEEENMDKAVFDTNAQCCDIMNHLIKKEAVEENLTIQDIRDNNAEWLLNKLQKMSAESALQTINDLYDELHKLQYPKTYEECCSILNLPHSGLTIDVPLHYSPTLIYLATLLVCRDAYWKIAGEQMGLGKPWKPDWESENTPKYTISQAKNKIRFLKVHEYNHILSFPTAEMREVFYENFKYLIESCKELL